jgi:hypothetical protein
MHNSNSDLSAQGDPLRGKVPQSFSMMARADPLLIVLLFSKECGYESTRPENAASRRSGCTVVNVAIPTLQATFHASVVDVQRVVESYGISLSALILAES